MTITGTHGYRAPEVYDRDYGKAADWWNVGILIIEMLTADNPLRGNNRKESEHLTKHKDLQLPRTIKDLKKNLTKVKSALQDIKFEQIRKQEDKKSKRTKKRAAAAIADAIGTPKGKRARR